MAKVGRPSIEYTNELGEEICEAISESVKSLRLLVKDHPDWPRITTLKKWKREIPAFSALYARAKHNQAHMFAEEMIDVAYDDSKDNYVDGEGKIQTNNAALQRAKLKIDSIKWYASKLAPDSYGDKKQDKTNSEDAISQVRVED